VKGQEIQSARVDGVGLTSCAALVVANMVGTGVFTSLGFQVGGLPSPPVILFLWALGGVLALCGALSYGELASALPRSGGEYHFLGRIYHPSLGFMAGAISLVVGFAAPIALSCMAFSGYLVEAFPGLPRMVASILVLAVVTAAHLINPRSSGIFQVVVTTLKLLLLLGFTSIGIVAGTGWPRVFSSPSDGMHLVFTAPFAVSLIFVMYAYSGWNAATYIIGEVRDPQRIIPRALFLGTAIVALIYLTLNAVFMASAPLSDLAGHVAVGGIAAEHLLGPTGGRVLSGLISLCLISSISAMTWAGPRVAQMIGEDYRLLHFLSRTNAGGVPVTATLLLSGGALLFIVTGTFEDVLVFAQLGLLACSFLAVLGLIILRFTGPELSRPFRCPGFPLTPLAFLLVVGFTIVHVGFDRPQEAGRSAAALAIAYGLYFVVRNRPA